jgi:hypothetical protein
VAGNGRVCIPALHLTALAFSKGLVIPCVHIFVESDLFTE